MNDVAYTDIFHQLGVGSADLLIQEQTQVVNTLQRAINKLDKAQGRLRADIELYEGVIRRAVNAINDGSDLKTIADAVDSLTHEEIISILRDHPEAWFRSSNDGEVFLAYHVERTSEQKAEAIKKVHDNYQPKINKAKADREANTKQLQELHRERAKAATLLGEMKRLRNVIFGNTKKSEV